MKEEKHTGGSWVRPGRVARTGSPSPAKRGRKPIGGIRIILRLTPEEVTALERKSRETGETRTQLIRHAIDGAYLHKRRKADWEKEK